MNMYKNPLTHTILLNLLFIMCPNADANFFSFGG